MKNPRDQKTFKKIPKWLKKEIEDTVNHVLHACRDCMRNQGIDTKGTSFDSNNSYFGEIIGMQRLLVALGYCFWGANNLPGTHESATNQCECKAIQDEQNVSWWFDRLKDKVLEEEGYFTDHQCQHCLKLYKKDSHGPINTSQRKQSIADWKAKVITAKIDKGRALTKIEMRTL